MELAQTSQASAVAAAGTGAGAPGAAAARRAAEDAFQAQHWAEAAEAFARVPDLQAGERLKATLAGNLAELLQHRPEVARRLIDAPADPSLRVAAMPSGALSIAHRGPDGGVTWLSAGADPEAAAAAMLPDLHRRCPLGEPVLLAGLGDGRLLRLLAAQPPRLLLTMQQPVYVLEPNASLALMALMLQDCRGPAGPIRPRRFHWFIGPDAAEQFARCLERDPMLPPPLTTVVLAVGGPAVARTAQEVVDRQAAALERSRAAVHERYAGRPASALARRLADPPDPAAPPRALLLTSRFTTVLQHSTRDLEQALRGLGWRTRLLIEEEDHQRLHHAAILAALRDFEPDLVFLLDHHRAEAAGLYPPELPVVCWIQDHLPHLARPEVGQRLTRRDFVLVDCADYYVRRYAYPRRQVLAFGPRIAPAAAADGPRVEAPDIVFVSHASEPPEAALAATVARYAATPQAGEVCRAAGECLLRRYAAGEACPTLAALLGLVHEAAARYAPSLAPEHRLHIAHALFLPLNNNLYRQQAVRWAAATARELGLTLGLYGHGWERHADLAPYARGPVQPGAALAALTRSARVNLQVVPYPCLHPRLLDGLASGGFFLIRRHPSDHAAMALDAWLRARGLDPAGGEAELRQRVPPGQRDEFDRLRAEYRRCYCPTPEEDAITHVAGMRQAGFLDDQGRILPDLEAVSFHDQASLADLVRRHLADAPGRAELARRQRASVLGRFGMEAGLRQVVAWIGSRLGDEPAP